MKRIKQTGAVSIEFGLGFMAFFLMIMLWAEMGYIAYVSSVNDLAIAEASREAKKVTNDSENNSQSTFMTEFRRVIREQSGAFGGIIDPDKYHLSVHYFASLDELGRYNGIGGDCSQNDDETETECGEPTDSSLAIYSVSYEYQPMLAFFMDGTSNFTREVIVIQEFERDQFKI
ncbi:pilus assembly protein [Vibrio aquaticus]|uniref:Pilus assembly protein n=1 Tax=Vibrio aquaticus TaxID=2496559 RepID=A0A432CYC1_9VIBR|nr:TadE family protein [Vibrio aquaticus]RTZ15587.1 pilus assembly protein [Vibrio aquaticus]